MSRFPAAIRMDMAARRAARRDRTEMLILRALVRGEDFTLCCESEEDASYWGGRIKSALLRIEEMSHA